MVDNSAYPERAPQSEFERSRQVERRVCSERPEVETEIEAHRTLVSLHHRPSPIQTWMSGVISQRDPRHMMTILLYRFSWVAEVSVTKSTAPVTRGIKVLPPRC